MSKKNNNKDSNENDSSEIAKENEKIEELINNPLLLKDYEDLEEEEELENSYTEKEQNMEEIQQYNLIKNKKSPKIHKDIIGNLLIELFEYHYNEIPREKKLNLSNKILESKCTIEFFCTKLNQNFSKYILVFLEHKIKELIKYTKKYTKNLVISKIESIKIILEVKNSLQLTGRDIIKIFEKPFQKTKNFDISSVLIIRFISDLLSAEKVSINDEEYGQIIQMDKYEENDRFEKYIEECRSYFEKIHNKEIEEDSDVEVYYEEENKIQTEPIDILTKETNDSFNNIIENEEKENINIIRKDSINAEEEGNNNDNEEGKKVKNSEEKKDIFIIGDIINKNNNPKKSSNTQENKSKKANNNSNKSKKNGAIIENKVEHYSNIEDLVNYINGSDNKKKRKKKRKKKGKVAKAKIIEEVKDSLGNEKDDIYESFKTDLINYTNNLKQVKKIRPKISDAFLEKLKSIN